MLTRTTAQHSLIDYGFLQTLQKINILCVLCGLQSRLLSLIQCVLANKCILRKRPLSIVFQSFTKIDILWKTWFLPNFFVRKADKAGTNFLLIFYCNIVCFFFFLPWSRTKQCAFLTFVNFADNFKESSVILLCLLCHTWVEFWRS